MPMIKLFYNEIAYLDFVRAIATSPLIRWTMSPEWTHVPKPSEFRGSANGAPCNEASGEIKL